MIYKSWEISWKMVQNLADSGSRDHAVVTLDGYLIFSRDRKLEPRRSYERYRESLTLALQKGAKVPAEVLEENRALVEKTMGADFLRDVKNLSNVQEKQTERTNRHENNEPEGLSTLAVNDFEAF